jgi:hypothetical protein
VGAKPTRGRKRDLSPERLAELDAQVAEADPPTVGPMTDDDLLDVLDEIREAAVAYEDAYAACLRGERLTSLPLQETAERLHDVTRRYVTELDRRRAARSTHRQE